MLLSIGWGFGMVRFRRHKNRDVTPALKPFYIAGVRFNPTSEILQPGERLFIKRELWHGERCYGIYSERGHRIGYVPRKLVPFFNDFVDRSWQLASVEPDSVPWKRYKVARVV